VVATCISENSSFFHIVICVFSMILTITAIVLPILTDCSYDGKKRLKMSSEFNRDNVMNSFIAPNSAWSIVRIKYMCEPNFFDVVIVHVVPLVSFITYSFPISPSSK